MIVFPNKNSSDMFAVVIYQNKSAKGDMSMFSLCSVSLNQRRFSKMDITLILTLPS
jgi:hypothetical protein